MSQAEISTKTVFLYVPNIIGYLRVLFTFISLLYMKNHPVTCMAYYSLSSILDALDGYAARRLNQSSSFGAILDMVTDRCTTACLVSYLCVLYPAWALLFQLLGALDLASHYMHIYASLSMGQGSHKTVKKEENWFLYYYYSKKPILFTMCAANELFFVALYLAAFPSHIGPKFGEIEIFDQTFNINIATLLVAFNFPLWFGKQLANVIQMERAAVLLARNDVEKKLDSLKKESKPLIEKDEKSD